MSGKDYPEYDPDGRLIQDPDSHIRAARPLVAPIIEMDDPTFIKHWNARHSTDGHLEERTSWPDEIATFRAFHDRITEGIAGHAPEHDHRQVKDADA